MSSQTHIFVFKLRTVIYTVVFIFFILILGLTIYLMFGKNNSNENNQPASAFSNLSENKENSYTPGIYSSSMNIGNYSLGIDVTINDNKIVDISLTSVSKEMKNDYPLLEPAIKKISSQIVKNQSTDNIELDSSMQFTETALIDTINTALNKAKK